MLFYPKGRIGKVEAVAETPASVVAHPPFADALGKLHAGLFPTTQIATARGWVPVARLVPGDMVLTFDNGCQPLREVITPCAEEVAPEIGGAAISVPSGALENRSPMMLMPGQVVLLDVDIAEDLFGEPFALVSAAALVGWRGIEAAEMPDSPIMTLRFDQDEIVYAHGATFLLCPAVADGAARAETTASNRPLEMAEARLLISHLIDAETLPEDQENGNSAPV